jgi:uncharacterized protein YkwD
MGRRAVLLLAVIAAGCGRVGFDPATGDGGGSGDAGGGADGAIADDGPTFDASPAVCGDTVCEGTAGETCGECGECAVSGVCGNGVCDAGEIDACADDCGPTPWPSEWKTFEDQLLAELNNRRTAGTTCPGGPQPAVAAVALDPTLTAISRNQAWDASHHDYVPGGSTGLRCDGEDLLTLMADAGFGGQRGFAQAYGFTTATDVMDFFVSNDAACLMLMRAGYTEVGVGYADDQPMWWVLTIH